MCLEDIIKRNKDNLQRIEHMYKNVYFNLRKKLTDNESSYNRWSGQRW